MRERVFAMRNTKELLRDVISYIFMLGLPLLLLLMMTLINSAIPKEANMTVFNIDKLSVGIVVFSFTFIMLFSCLQVSKDRSSSFLIRLYSSPMTAFDFIAGYTLPLLFVGFCQAIITFLASVIIGLFTDVSFNFVNILFSIVTMIPAEFLFIGIGILFGTIFNDKVAPPMSSLVITVASLLGGIWMDVDALGGPLLKICQVLPFYHAVRAGRAALSGNYSDIMQSFIIVTVYALVFYVLAVLVFNSKMKSDLK